MVELVPLLRKRGARRVLDLGCGAGRHVVYLTQKGFDIYGMDLSSVGLERTRQWLNRSGGTATLAKWDMTVFPYPYEDGFFDTVLSLYVLYHTTLANICRAIGEIERTLRPGGLVLLILQSTQSPHCGRGEKIEPNTFIRETGGDRGVPHHYSDEAELRELLSRFDNLELRHVATAEGEHPSAHWWIRAEKPW